VTFFLEGGLGLVLKRGCLLTLAYYVFPRWYEFGERRCNDIFTGENRRTRRKTCPRAALSITNPTWIDPGANPGHRGEMPATNDLSHGTSLEVTYVSSETEIRDLRHFDHRDRVTKRGKETVSGLRVVSYDRGYVGGESSAAMPSSRHLVAQCLLERMPQRFALHSSDQCFRKHLWNSIKKKTANCFHIRNAYFAILYIVHVAPWLFCVPCWEFKINC
jgi:hypothetical protein